MPLLLTMMRLGVLSAPFITIYKIKASQPKEEEHDHDHKEAEKPT